MPIFHAFSKPLLYESNINKNCQVEVPSVTIAVKLIPVVLFLTVGQMLLVPLILALTHVRTLIYQLYRLVSKEILVLRQG